MLTTIEKSEIVGLSNLQHSTVISLSEEGRYLGRMLFNEQCKCDRFLMDSENLYQLVPTTPPSIITSIIILYHHLVSCHAKLQNNETLTYLWRFVKMCYKSWTTSINTYLDLRYTEHEWILMSDKISSFSINLSKTVNTQENEMFSSYTVLCLNNLQNSEMCQRL